jgi:hypothetical protein
MLVFKFFRPASSNFFWISRSSILLFLLGTWEKFGNYEIQSEGLRKNSNGKEKGLWYLEKILRLRNMTWEREKIWWQERWSKEPKKEFQSYDIEGILKHNVRDLEKF